MTYYNDLEICDYYGEVGPDLLAVGWLESGNEYSKGIVPNDILEKIKKLKINSWEPFAFPGIHECDLCKQDQNIGVTNIIIPFKNKYYVCPELIIHYIEEHMYMPPEIFIDAVKNCPDYDSQDFKERIKRLENIFNNYMG